MRLPKREGFTSCSCIVKVGAFTKKISVQGKKQKKMVCVAKRKANETGRESCLKTLERIREYSGGR